MGLFPSLYVIFIISTVQKLPYKITSQQKMTKIQRLLVNPSLQKSDGFQE
jgi:hypothetical protein